ncbi:30S ribosomal protein S10 [Mesomycoplasma conjunctivae]|uniref:Small ribosomal subunit protein uS10 n=1 Tax=Mesomycoplasma conjunctivae (strain ATCC 25834 / NCTC 10147 / HRC/581) TaxID=572263 RepID=C5J5T1_MESCH|nr:30S ribosomal protein S10 [Mesomycoplasma conjunctivae]CAT04820.1 30S ribosomal protein S10 [Mesomycoplasma conjunctivae]VEU65855.1 30S ribosomal protein S10 [Mesomycoplasma conjunctivae]
MNKNLIKIRLKSYDHRQVDAASKKLILLARELDVQTRGPVPLPTKHEVFTILRSVHINKKSREQFGSRTHKRLVILEINPSNQKAVIDKINRTQLPAGVGLEIEVS